MRNSISFAMIVLISIFGVNGAKADFITGVTATTTMGTFSSYDIEDLTSNFGLSSFEATATHSNSFETMWLSNGVTTGSITFDLGGTFNLSDIVIWNYNYAGSITRGVQTFSIESSINGIDFDSVLGATTLAIASGTNSEPSQTFSLGDISASHVRMVITENYGDSSYTGLSKVHFVEGDATSAVPEPSSLALFALAVCTLGTRRFSRRKADAI